MPGARFVSGLHRGHDRLWVVECMRWLTERPPLSQRTGQNNDRLSLFLFTLDLKLLHHKLIISSHDEPKKGAV